MVYCNTSFPSFLYIRVPHLSVQHFHTFTSVLIHWFTMAPPSFQTRESPFSHLVRFQQHHTFVSFHSPFMRVLLPVSAFNTTHFLSFHNPFLSVLPPLLLLSLVSITPFLSLHNPFIRLLLPFSALIKFSQHHIIFISLHNPLQRIVPCNTFSVFVDLFINYS